MPDQNENTTATETMPATAPGDGDETRVVNLAGEVIGVARPISPAHAIAPTRPVETWAKQKRTAPWAAAAAGALHRWAVGEELTEADYDAAIAAACNVQLG